jgi:hypothetical protein
MNGYFSLALSVLYANHFPFNENGFWILCIFLFSFCKIILSYLWLFFPQRIQKFWIVSETFIILGSGFFLTKVLEFWNHPFWLLGIFQLLLTVSLFVGFLKVANELTYQFFQKYKFILFSSNLVVVWGLFSFLFIFFNEVKIIQKKVKLKFFSSNTYTLFWDPNLHLVSGIQDHHLALQEIELELFLRYVSDFNVTRNLEIVSWTPEETKLPEFFLNKNLCEFNRKLCE